jgi:hypothetical protein
MSNGLISWFLNDFVRNNDLRLIGLNDVLRIKL